MTGRSLGEIEALARTAARGAGLSWGHAEDAGRAARWLEARGLPGAALLAELLASQQDIPYPQLIPDTARRPWTGDGAALCPVASGTAFSDLAALMRQDRELALGPVRYPLLLLPFAAQAGAAPLALIWPGARFDLDAEGLWQSGSEAAAARLALAPLVTLRPGAQREPGAERLPMVARGRMDPDTEARLRDLARRTHAPATEHSRLAGAGTTDRD